MVRQLPLSVIKRNTFGTSLVVQWLRIHLPVQGMGFNPWFWKIPHATEQLSLSATTSEARAPRPREPQQEKPLQREARAPRQRAAPARHN